MSIPLHFETKQDYISKLSEMLLVQAECDRLSVEMVAEKNVSYVFEEKLQIYSRMKLKIPKKLHEYIRQHTVMSVVIREKGSKSAEYLGNGVVKRVLIARNS